MFSDVGIMPAAITLDALIVSPSNRKWDQEFSKKLEARKSAGDSDFPLLTPVSLSCIHNRHELKCLEMQGFHLLPVPLSILVCSPFFCCFK